jgi:hypothetical protein
LLRLAQGQLDAADAMIRRVLAETEDPISRARMLGPYVEVVLATGDTSAAGTGVEELRGVTAELGSPLLPAQAARTAGAVFLAEGDTKAALVELRRRSTSSTASACGTRRSALGSSSSTHAKRSATMTQNRVIAQELVISEKTVASHVSHISRSSGSGRGPPPLRTPTTTSSSDHPEWRCSRVRYAPAACSEHL